jgi:hypothetical protein
VLKKKVTSLLFESRVLSINPYSCDDFCRPKSMYSIYIYVCVFRSETRSGEEVQENNYFLLLDMRRHSLLKLITT